MNHSPQTESIRGYHAHIYYDTESRDRAATARAMIEAKFTVVMGRWRDQPVGPHPKATYQVAFAPAEFGRVVPWLMLNRGGLVVLVHPETGDDYADHAEHALWMGRKLELKLDFLRNLPPR